MDIFEEIGLSQNLLKAIKKLGFAKPTQIQEQAIPHILAGEDVVGESATGSGKTLAFGCGIVDQVKPGKGIQALILAPTRELAEQVKNSIRDITRELKVAAIYGGVAIGPQMNDLKRCEVVVATPGRLIDHLERKSINISKLKILVLDEADRMLDMGFIDSVEEIMQSCPKEKQTLFFTATFSGTIKDLVKKYMKHPVKISAVKMVDPAKLTQEYYDVPKNIKLSLLIHLLKKEKTGLAMIFCNSRKITEFVSKNLKTQKINSIAIHGGLSQNKRSSIIKMFNRGKVDVLVCTDVAARGLHIDNVTHIYNYDIPKDPKDYVHRIGRTARAGEEGKVTNLLCEYDYQNFSRIQSEHRDYIIERKKKPHVERMRPIMPRNKREFPKKHKTYKVNEIR